MSEVLRIGKNITVLPVIHGSADFSLEVRRMMLNQPFDCLAVPLPPSFREPVIKAIELLPTISLVLQKPTPEFFSSWSPDAEEQAEDEDTQEASFVPIDPCQPVVAAIRIAQGEHLRCEFIDAETATFEPNMAILPDPYAIKKVSLDRFAAASLPEIDPPATEQVRDRVIHMAARLRQLENQYQSILLVCSIVDWPWIREAFHEQIPDDLAEDEVPDPEVFQVDAQTLVFLTGELPFITGLYERARSELEDDENITIDGLKSC